MKNWSELIARGRAGAPASKTSNNDTTLFVPRQCFVVMPFEKKHFLKPGAIVDKKEGGVAVHEEQIETIDFDQVYKKLISAAVSKASKNFPQEIECKRSDEVTQSGFIQKDMITRLATADIVIVDITTLNANVFYELGIRHSIRRSATVIIRKRGTTVPFNVTGMRIFDYSLEEDDANRDTDGRTPLQRSIDDLEQVIRHSLSHKENDSLVHNVLPNLNVHQSSYPLIDRHKVSHEVMDADNEAVPGARIGFITGDIMHIHDIDGWINAENTNMQMARIHDGSVSSLIRYFGAKKDWCGRVLDDTIADTLSNVAHRMGVEASTVVVTRPAQLKATNGVKAVFHTAAMQGEPGYGYQPVRDYAGCLRRVLREVDAFNLRRKHFAVKHSWRAWLERWRPSPRIRSVICPLFGSRSATQHPQDVASNLFYAATAFLLQYPNSQLKEIYFLAYTDQDKILCETALGHLLQRKRILPNSKAAGKSEGGGESQTHAEQAPIASTVPMVAGSVAPAAAGA